MNIITFNNETTIVLNAVELMILKSTKITFYFSAKSASVDFPTEKEAEKNFEEIKEMLRLL
jgi:hypothetical protein